MFLDESLWFPNPRQSLAFGELKGLVAVGGELTVDRLLLAYRSGIFPWSVDPVTWWSPDPRGIIELDQFHASRSLRRTLRQGAFRVTRNQAFLAVMEACAAPAPDRPHTWISSQFLQAYTRLHTAGYAHSVECWVGSDLVGGIYGVQVGGLFAGESMFHRVKDASKVALAALVERLRQQGFALFDIQMTTPHTEQFGATNIGREEYLRRLAEAIKVPCQF
jgi:leucyl/phenylalanyl-tRNA--protein transferase